MGMKRGAILIGVICLIWFLHRTLKSTSQRNKLLLAILTTITLIVGTLYVRDFYDNSEYFQYRVEQTLDGDSSGRDNIVGLLWEYFINQDSMLNIMLGNGAYETINIAGKLAHNDWLELLICQGLLGIVIYIAYYASLWKMFKQNRNNILVYNIMGMCLIIMVASSLFSMSYNNLSLGITLCLGYCLAHQEKSIKKS